MADHIDDLCVIDEAPPLPPRRRAPHTSGLRAAVRVAIARGLVDGARHIMAQHCRMDWAVEMAMIADRERRAA